MHRRVCRLVIFLCLLPACSFISAAQSWQAPTGYPAAADAPTRIVTAELMGTQSSDVLAVTTAHDLVLYANDGAGHLSSSPQILRENVTAATAAKFSGSMMDDVLVISSATPTSPLQLMLLPSQGGRTFGTSVAIAPQLALGATCQLYAADFNGDGAPDVLVFCVGSNTLLLGTNNGKDGFTFANVPSVLESGRLIQNVSAGDLDGDGLADIVVQSSPAYNPADSRIDVLWNSAAGTFIPQQDYISQPDVTTIYVSKVDGHPSANLVIASSNGVSVFADQANRNSLTQSSALQVPSGCHVAAVASGRILDVKYSLGQDVVVAAACGSQNQLLSFLNTTQVATALSPRLDLSSGTPVVDIHAEVSSAQSGTIPTGQLILTENGNSVSETLADGSADFSFPGTPGSTLFTVAYAGDPNTAGAKQYASVVMAGEAAGTNSGSQLQTSSPAIRTPIRLSLNNQIHGMLRVSLPGRLGSPYVPALSTPIRSTTTPTGGGTGTSTASSYTLSVPSVASSDSGLLANTPYTVVSSVAVPSGTPVSTSNGFPASVTFQINSATIGQGTAATAVKSLSSWSQSACTWTGQSWTGSYAPDGSGSYPVSMEQDVVTYSSPIIFPASGTYQVSAILTPTESGSSSQTQSASLPVSDAPMRSILRPMASGGSNGAACNPTTFSYGSSTTCMISSACSPELGSYTIKSSPSGISASGSFNQTNATTYLSGPVGTYTTTIVESTSCGTVSFPGPTLTITKATPSLSVSCSPNPITYGSQNTTCTANVSGGATGTVAFTANGGAWTTVSLSGGTASATGWSGWNAGTYPVGATYNGDSNNNSVSASTTITINKANTTITGGFTANPITHGQSLVVSGQVSCNSACGNLQYFIDGTSWGTNALNSSGSYGAGYGGASVGNHSIKVNYLGDANYNPSSWGPATLTVNMATPSLAVSCSPNPITFGSQSTTCSTSLTGGSSPTGTESWTIDGGAWTSTGINGSAGGFAGSAAGSYTIGVTYSGDGNNNSVSASTTLTIQKAASSISFATSATTAIVGQSIGVSASVCCSQNGTVQFYDSTWNYATVTTSGSGASSTFSASTPGTYQLYASWPGNGNYNTATSSPINVTFVMANSSVSLACTPNPADLGQAVSCTASVSGGASGESVDFLDGTTQIGVGTISSGVATFSTTSLTVGTHSLTAVYVGDATYNPSTSNAVSESINNPGTVTDVSSTLNPSSYGQAVAFSALVNTGGSAPTGTITFENGGASIGSGSVSTVSTTNLAPFSDDFTKWTEDGSGVAAPTLQPNVMNGPDGSSNTASEVTYPVTTSGYSEMVLPEANGIAYANLTMTFSVWIKGTVANQPLVMIISDEPYTGNAVSQDSCNTTLQWQRCSVTYTFPSNAGTGFHLYLRAIGYSTTSSFYVWGAQFEQASNPGPYIATNGSAASGSGGVATFTTSSLPVGSLNITAVYGGDANNLTSTSPTLWQNVNKATPSISASCSPNPVGYLSYYSCTADVSGSATGTVTWSGVFGGPTTSLSGGATSTPPTQATGSSATYSGTVTYNGDGNYNAVSTSASLTVVSDSQSITFTAPPSPVTYGVAPITLSATASSGLPVTFSVLSGPGAVSGSTLTITGIGTIVVAANQAGDTNYAPVAQVTQSVVVNPTPTATTLSSSLNPSGYGQAVAFSALVNTGGTIPTGNITFDDGGTSSGTGTVTSVQTTNLLPSQAASAWGTDAGSSGPVITSMTGSDPLGGTNALQMAFPIGSGTNDRWNWVTLSGPFASRTFTASIWLSAPSPTTILLDVNEVGGVGARTATTITIGTQWQRYSVSVYIPSTEASTPNLVLDLSNPSGEPAKTLYVFGPQIEDSPTVGPYIFTNGSAQTGYGGIASLSTSSLAAGSHSITAVYGGDTNDTASTSAPLTQVVNQATPTITWATPAAITYGTALSGTQLNATSGGVAGTFAYTPAAGTVLGAGAQTLSVIFTPTDSTDYNPASDTTSLTVNKATDTFTIASSANPSVYGASVSITVSGPAGATGTITLLDGTNPVGTGTLSNGVATISVPLFAAGSHSLTASYAGDANFLPSTSASYTQVVQTAAVAISISSTVNPSNYGETVTFTFTFKGVTGGAVPSGLAVVTDGVNNLGTWTLNSSGVATLTTSALVAGTHSITAAYQGDSNYH